MTAATTSSPRFSWPRRLTRPRASHIVLGLVFGGLTGLLLLRQPGLILTDTNRDVYVVPGRVLRAAVSAWSENSYLGAPNYDNGILPVALLSWLLHLVAMPSWLVARLIKLGFLLLAAVGVARCYRRLGLPCGPGGAGPAAAAVVYVANPFAVTGAATLPLLQPYALLPWLVVSLLALVETGGWRRAAAAALVFAAMAGVNAGVVPLLVMGLSLGITLVHALSTGTAAPPRTLLLAVSRFAMLSVLLSAYWLVPALSALSTGTAVAGSTETPDSVAATSSYAEVLRGLGLWTVYGSSPRGPFEPGFTAYLVTAPVVLASFLLPVLAFGGAVVSRARGRLLPVLALLAGAVVSVGIYPLRGRTPVGHALSWAFAHVPGAIAFRTTVKAGPLVGFGLSLLTAVLVATVAARLRGRPLRTGVAALAATALLVGWSWPMVTHGLYRNSLPVPGYWHKLADDLNAQGGDGRVLFLPGQVGADYRWGQPSPDDIFSSLLVHRRAVVRTTVPATTAPAANLLAALDLALQSGQATGSMVSAVARALGATDVVLRNDVHWEYDAGARPAALVGTVSHDPGLAFVRAYGVPGQNTGTPAERSGPDGAFEARLPPLLHYAVRSPRSPARVESARGAVLVDGDAAGVAQASADGDLTRDAAVLEAGDLTGSALARVVPDLGRLVLTDTNRRRTYDDHRVASTGPLVGAQDGVGTSRVLYGPADQTVQRFDGDVADISATQEGSVFGVQPDSGAALAFDGRPGTAWRFGDFGSAVGQQVVVRFGRPVSLRTVVLHPLPTGPVRPSQVEVSTSQGAVRVPLVGTETIVQLPGTGSTDHLTVRVVATSGRGINGIGFSEIDLPGMSVSARTQLPTALVARLRALPSALRARIAKIPLAVVLTRDVIEREASLARDFALPDARRLRASGVLRAATTLSDAQADALAGVPSPVEVRGSSRLFDAPQFRASAAFDGNPMTQWVPSGNPVGAFVDARFPSRQVDVVTVVQGAGTGEGGHVTAALLQIGDLSLRVALKAGTTVLHVPLARVSQVRLTVKSIEGGRVIGLAELTLSGPGSTSALAPRGHAAVPCITIARLDGVPVDGRPEVDQAQLVDGGPVPFVACGRPTALGAGPHRVISAAWTLDRLRLSDDLVSPPSAPLPTAVLRFSNAVRQQLEVTGAQAPYYVTTGAAFDPRWRASANGRSLGPPQLVDGYAVGWRVDDLRAATITVTYRPQRALQGAAWTTVAAVALCLAGLTLPRRPAPGMVVATVPGPRRKRRLLRRWVLAVGSAALLGGPVLGMVALALALLDLVGRPSARSLGATGILLAGTVPLAWFVSNRTRFGRVGFDLVENVRVPHLLAAVALLLVVVATVRDVADPSPRTDPS